MEERTISPDLFPTDPSSSQESESSAAKSNSSPLTVTERWSGYEVSKLHVSNSPWNYHFPRLHSNRYHTVLFELPANFIHAPRPYVSANPCFWNLSNVKMPFSEKNVFPSRHGKESILRPRWEIIQCALLRDMSSSFDLEETIFSYNLRHKRFYALHYLFEDVFTEDETKNFFYELLPRMARLALQLPELIRAPIPLLRQGKAHAITLSQQQIASLLANAFFCTFPWKKEITTYPGMNFNRLFECGPDREANVSEKLKCILHYFRRVCEEIPTGAVTFERKHIPRREFPRWDEGHKQIGDIKLHVSDFGTIENNGLGMLQVDFANCMLGGGVLGYGCVQEEIRFSICPELLISRLFSEQLEPNEALLMIGAECYSKYKGYADTFEWDGNYNDKTPRDESGRRRTSIIAIDALYYPKPTTQFKPSNIIRELNKAYVGFYDHVASYKPTAAPVATGNWGCGAFRGNTHLKALIQLMACREANRNIVYYTFGDRVLRDQLFDIYSFLVKHKITVSQLWQYLNQFNEDVETSYPLLKYIKKAHVKPGHKLNDEKKAAGKKSPRSSKSPDPPDSPMEEEAKTEFQTPRVHTDKEIKSYFRQTLAKHKKTTDSLSSQTSSINEPPAHPSTSKQKSPEKTFSEIDYFEYLETKKTSTVKSPEKPKLSQRPRSRATPVKKSRKERKEHEIRNLLEKKLIDTMDITHETLKHQKRKIVNISNVFHSSDEYEEEDDSSDGFLSSIDKKGKV